MQQDFPTLNGIVPSWADIAVTITPESASVLKRTDMSAINWKDDVEVGEQVVGGIVVATTTGQKKTEAGMTLYRTGHMKLITALADVAPKNGDEYQISLVHFDILIQHTPPGSDDIFKVEILGCRLLGRDASAQQGTDPDARVIALNPKKVIEYDSQGRKVVLL